jgi:hypothetical protein
MVVHAALEQVQRHREGGEPKFLVKSQLLETKEILVDFIGEISAYKLFTPIIEGI